MSPFDRIQDLLRSLMPIDTAISRFEAGGKERGREIARIYEELADIERELHDNDDDDDGEAGRQ